MKLICKLNSYKIQNWYGNWMVMRLILKLDSNKLRNWYVNWIVMKYEIYMSIGWCWIMILICKLHGDEE